MLKFFKGVVAEMKKVSWPTGFELIKKTAIVIFTVSLVMAFTYVVDLAISTAIRYIK